MFLETKVWIGEHKIILKLEINKNKVEGGRVVKEANFAFFFFFCFRKVQLYELPFLKIR